MAATILGRFIKQPDERLRYAVSYVDWLAARNDTAASFSVTAEDGVTVEEATLQAGVIYMVLEGGLSGASYKVTTLLTTTAGLIKEADFILKVKAV